uniref:CDK5 regulatory subunit-associated protein 2/Myomegalin coiled coil domain-containing protein n=1 Tax=Fundulus heteroclitus TaxID=8078 RepID=A0A3Q2T0W1_FUNHE
MIGGDSQQDALPHLLALQQEHDALNKALRAEQQLYSSLVRTVKEQDSAQRLHALQLELTAVQLLRQQLEDSIKTNEELRDDLEREIQRAKLREGLDLIDPKELESMRHQLEDAQRWNASLQARLGAIQNRGGGVGGTGDSGDTFSFIGDQTSYMSICVGEGPDDSLSQLSPQELRQMVLDLQDRVAGLQSLNNELQSRLSEMEKSERDVFEKEDKDVTSRSRFKQQLEKTQERTLPDSFDSRRPPGPDKEIQTDISLGEIASVNLLGDEIVDSRSSQSREHAHSDSGDDHRADRNTDATALTSLLEDFGASSVLQLREELRRLRSENLKLWGLLKEQKSAECKEKESTDVSGNSSDGPAELRRSLETLQSESEDGSMVFKLSKETTEKSSSESHGETTPTNISAPDEKPSPKHQSQLDDEAPKQHVTRHRAGVKSRLPVPVRLRVEGGTKWPSGKSEQWPADAQQPCLDDDYGSEQPNTPPSSTIRCPHTSSSPAESDRDSEPRAPAAHTLSDSTLLSQLELLNQECQEKEALIDRMSEQLADLEELQAQLHEKERLNEQYAVALQAAQSTIAYLTAYSLDNQSNFGPRAAPGSAGPDDLHVRCVELQKALQEKEELNSQLIELLNMAEKAIDSSQSQDKKPEADDLCSRIEGALHQAHSDRHAFNEGSGAAEESVLELRRHADSLQKALLEQSKLNAELQEQVRAANAAAQRGGTLSNGPIWRPRDATAAMPKDDESERGFDNNGLNQEMFGVLMKCFSATESAVSSLAAHCKNASPPASDTLELSAELQRDFDLLQRALQERRGLSESAQQGRETEGLKLHQDLCLLYRVFSDRSRRLADLQASVQEERGHRGESEAHRTAHDAKGLAPDVKLQLETLHKALREKKKACKSLEEKLATALTSTPAAETAPKDLEVGVNPSRSASSLPSLLKTEHATFSSTENLDSNSSTPYPSSPALSSAKVSLKGLQTYEDYGASEDPLQLQAQVRELKVQLEHQTKVILQMQSLLHRNSLPGDAAANACEPLAARENRGTPKADRTQERGGKREADNQAARDRAAAVNAALWKERTPDRSTSEQLRQSRSRSTSPARLDSLVKSQARELSQLRQQIKESRRLGALQRRQLEDLNKAFKELLHAGEVDRNMGEVIKEQLEKSLSLLDGLEGRLDKEESPLVGEDAAALDLSYRYVTYPASYSAQHI